jgi:threonine dehydrogenase-like Zn-dependent dehydrogenase
MKIPSSVNDESALLSGDILATGWHCATKAQIKPDGIYVVIGCGPVGLMSILAARALGARNLYAIDPIEERRKQAEKWGAASIDPTKVDPQEIILKASKGRGADAALEAVGSNVTLTLAVNLLRPGGILSSVGVHTAKEFPFSPIMAYDKNLEMHIGRCPARYYMPSLLAWLESAELDFSSFFTHRMKLSEAAEAYRIFNTKSQGCIKALLIPD